ncbi:helix-turn-helix domain-containing protein [Scandinavium sp. V105_16]|uniref:Helix-turn-helix domain-containing protein n=1 Tax=Scandinavium lactucae TaxID=3095028 RepID=A0AAJ2SCI1_9ENTR|nr:MULTISPECIES: helix-turn-helix domain-containing protein [unclassified Scandinavium]MDX6022447.1 helix-turn-helix domain-containing protein [Scandinavium sp. V105_16]MDX6033711.1 helix-turn-helix domain-containing protein [Scandinavium sp. V105_12]MDX6042439.1 helix-turn-helix domain-containing protein [Scandinavium sp. V105_6]MDX6052440.1 helix-turn-helix domain-containing protein [Scandinavium sp. V105_1]
MDQSGSEFAVTVLDVRQLSQEESNALTLLWLLEGSAELETQDQRQTLSANSLTVINRNQRFHLTSTCPNATLQVTLSGPWLTRLYNDIFSHEYHIPDESSGSWPQCDELRHLLRQLLVVTLINHPSRYRLEAQRWLSEILLLLTTRFQQPARISQRSDNPGWSKRITQVVERIDASFTRRITLAEIAEAEFVSEAWLSRLFRKEVGVSFMQYITTLRLEKAADALRLSNRPLHQIALEQGFASTRMMSDLFRRYHQMTPREFRRLRQNPSSGARPRQATSDCLFPVAVDKLFSLLNEPETRGWEPSPLTLHQQQERIVDLRELTPRTTPLRHTRVMITLRELDDLLREDVRRELESLDAQIPVHGIDISEPFLSSRLFASGWDDPLMAGYACWYNLHQIFSWLAEKRWTVLLHTGLTTRSDLLRQFLKQSINHFPPQVTAGWQFVWHWSAQASDETRENVWQTQRAALREFLPKAKFGLWHRFAVSPLPLANEAIFQSRLLREADFLACPADANELLNLTELDPARLASTENYPVQKIRQIQSALRQQQISLPLWLLSWNTLTGNTRATNGWFFRGALLMHNLLGLSEQVWLAGFWLNSGLQGEARANDTLDTSSLALQYNHGLPRPIYWVLWLWQRLRGDVLVNDKNLLLLRHEDRYQLLLRNTVVFNPWLSSEEAFIQRFRQQYRVQLGGLSGAWRIKSHLYDQHNGALYPLLDAFTVASGPDEEIWRWVRHKARPTLAVRDEHLHDSWQITDSLESNALVLYELTPIR